jgi:hypothetical protein
LLAGAADANIRNSHDEVLMTSYGNVPAPSSLASSTLSHRPKRKSVFRRWWFWAVLSGALVLLWTLGSSLLAARTLSNDAVARFHQELNQGSFDQIWQESDQAFQPEAKREDLFRVLNLVRTKLGDAESANLINVQMNTSPRGSFLVTVYNSRFAKDRAVETFAWKKTGNGLKLYSYNIRSEALTN